MQSLVLVIFIGLLAGASVGLQSPLASMITQKLGMMESVVIIHLSGTIAGILALLVTRKGVGNLGQWKDLPWYLLAAGALGLVVVSGYSFMIPRIGVASSVLIALTGQLLISAVLDNYGFLGAAVRPITLPRLLGIAVMFLGVWLTVRE